MPDISQNLKVEGPGPREPRDEAGVMVEYLGVRVIIAARCSKPRDRGVWVIIQDGDGSEHMLELEATAGGVTKLPVPVEDVVVVEVVDGVLS